MAHSSIYDYFKSRFKFVQPFACGYCPDCLAKKSRDWSTRMFCELQTTPNKNASFLTLTYDDNKLNAYGDLDENPTRGISLIKEDFQKFMKRLRKELSKYDIKIRYFACGEYGSKTLRPHFHCIIYNYSFPDKVLSTQMYSKRGKEIYESELLNDCWKYGLASVQTVNAQTMDYVSKYITKKQFGLSGDISYNLIIGDTIIKRCKEFNLMSRRKPIGYNYFLANYNQLTSRPYLYVGDSTHNKRYLPRVFLHWIKLQDEEIYNNILTEYSKYVKVELSLDRLAQKEQYRKANFDRAPSII